MNQREVDLGRRNFSIVRILAGQCHADRTPPAHSNLSHAFFFNRHFNDVRSPRPSVRQCKWDMGYKCKRAAGAAALRGAKLVCGPDSLRKKRVRCTRGRP